MKRVVFISAVTRELKGARQIVANTLVAIDFEPVWQDVFDLSADEIPELLRKKIDAAGAVVQIVGDAYGAEPPTPPVPFERCSYTQYEALYAKLKKKPVYYLVAAPELPRDQLPDRIDGPGDDDPQAAADAEARRRLQAEYKRRILKGSAVYYPVATPDAIENAVRKLKSKGLGGGRGCQVQFSIAIALSLLIAGAGLAAMSASMRSNLGSPVEVAYSPSDRDRAPDLRLPRDLGFPIPASGYDPTSPSVSPAPAMSEGPTDSSEFPDAASDSGLPRSIILSAMRQLPDTVSKATRSNLGDDLDWLVLDALAGLAFEYDVYPWDLETAISERAGEILADESSDPADRQLALFAERRYSESEALGLQIADQGDRRAESALILSGHAARVGGRAADALGHYERAVARIDRASDPIAWSDAKAWEAFALEDLGRYDDAAKALESSLRARRESVGFHDTETLSRMSRLVGVLLAAERFDEAFELLDETRAAMSVRLLGPAGAPLELRELREAYRGSAMFAAMLPLFEAAIASNQARLGDDHPVTIASRFDHALYLGDLGRFDLAKARFRSLLRMLGDADASAMRIRCGLGICLMRAGEVRDALKEIERAWEQALETLPPGHPWIAEHGTIYASALRSIGQEHEAEIVRRVTRSLAKSAARGRSRFDGDDFDFDDAAPPPEGIDAQFEEDRFVPGEVTIPDGPFVEMPPAPSDEDFSPAPTIPAPETSGTNDAPEPQSPEPASPSPDAPEAPAPEALSV